jgi:hypothetical protein
MTLPNVRRSIPADSRFTLSFPGWNHERTRSIAWLGSDDIGAFGEMHAEAQITPLVLTFPPEVIERVAAYAKDHSMEANAYAPTRYNYLDSNH